MVDIKEVIAKSTTYKGGKPVSSFKLRSESQSSQLEPIYYWILDFIEGLGYDIEKVTDNFMSSPGSGHFAEIGQRATRMQEEAMKIMGGINQIVKSILNLIYDLKEFEARLKNYKDYKEGSGDLKEGALLALKQIWLDNVDMKRGPGAIHQMSTMQMGFVTLRDAFFVAKSVEDVKKMDVINDQVKRALMPRVKEFFDWVDYSHKELEKRYEVEKNYLRTQVENVRLYTAWAKPYLESAEQLRQKGFESSAALVNAFSTSMFELTLFCKKKESAPEKFSHYNFKRNYNSCMVVSFKFRGHVLQRVNQKGDFAPAVGGRVDMTFDSYSLNDQEIKVMNKEREKAELGSVFSIVKGNEDSLKVLQDDLDHFLNDDKKKEEAKAKKSADNPDPFSALFGGIADLFRKKKDSKKAEPEEVKDVKKDNYYEEVYRAEAASAAKGSLYAVYDIYKKAHGLASTPEELDS